MVYINIDLYFSSFILDRPEIFASSPLSSADTNHYKIEPPLSIKPNKYSSKRNDNANTIDTTSEEEPAARTTGPRSIKRNIVKWKWYRS